MLETLLVFFLPITFFAILFFVLIDYDDLLDRFFPRKTTQTPISPKRVGTPIAIHDALTEQENLVFSEFLLRLKQARQTHPVFARSPEAGLSIVLEELGEVAQAHNDHNAFQRHNEAIDLMVTAFRFALEEWE